MYLQIGKKNNNSAVVWFLIAYYYNLWGLLSLLFMLSAQTPKKIACSSINFIERFREYFLHIRSSKQYIFLHASNLFLYQTMSKHFWSRKIGKNVLFCSFKFLKIQRSAIFHYWCTCIITIWFKYSYDWLTGFIFHNKADRQIDRCQWLPVKRPPSISTELTGSLL